MVNIRRGDGEDSEEDTNFNNDISNQQDGIIFIYWSFYWSIWICFTYFVYWSFCWSIWICSSYFVYWSFYWSIWICSTHFVYWPFYRSIWICSTYLFYWFLIDLFESALHISFIDLFIDLFESAVHVSGDKLAHLQEHVWLYVQVWCNAPILLPTGDKVEMELLFFMSLSIFLFKLS